MFIKMTNALKLFDDQSILPCLNLVSLEPSVLDAGDAIHPVLRKREEFGFETKIKFTYSQSLL